MKFKDKKEIIFIAAILIVQTIIFIIAGMGKSYIHMDEAYSLGLSSYERTEIQDNDDFYDNWHTKEYYEDYLTVNDDEAGRYSMVYENQKNDVHPPLYYLILRFAMGFHMNDFSIWPGVIINIIIYVFITLFMYFILQELLQKEQRTKEKSMVLAFISGITLASVSTALYIRMYALSELNILITTFLHIKLLKSEKPEPKLLILIGLSALAGVLTHYYYIFFLAMMYLIFAVRYIKQKEYKKLMLYTLAMVSAAIISLIIWPYSIKHMFFGYRGQGVLDKLKDISMFLVNILLYLCKLHFYGFNNLLLIFLIIICIYKIRLKKNNIKIEKNQISPIIALPTAFYFLMVAIASPWIELRYIMPVCGLIFVSVIYYLYRLLNAIYKEKVSNIIIGTLLLITLIFPLMCRMEPEVMYSDKKEIVSKMENELNVPTVYFFNSDQNRFLDDILLFAKADNSYVAKDTELTEKNVQNILENKDLSKGVLVFINREQKDYQIINLVKNAMDLTDSTHLKSLNACEVYLIK